MAFIHTKTRFSFLFQAIFDIYQYIHFAVLKMCSSVEASLLSWAFSPSLRDMEQQHTVWVNIFSLSQF
jgi:hypothetical protein